MMFGKIVKKISKGPKDIGAMKMPFHLSIIAKIILKDERVKKEVDKASPCIRFEEFPIGLFEYG